MSRLRVLSTRIAIFAASSGLMGMTALAEPNKQPNIAPVAPPSVSVGAVSSTDSVKETHIDVDRPYYTWDKGTGVVTVDPLQYTRIDIEYMKTPKFRAFKDGNALHDTLSKPNLIEKYEVYKKNDSDEILCVVRFGSMINGHPTIVHGGITSLVLDNSYGWLFFSLDLPMAVTANLQVNYRAPLPMNTTCILKAKMDRLDGRKMFMKGTVHDLHGKLIADSSSLFVALKPMAAAAARAQMKIAEYVA